MKHNLICSIIKAQKIIDFNLGYNTCSKYDFWLLLAVLLPACVLLYTLYKFACGCSLYAFRAICSIPHHKWLQEKKLCEYRKLPCLKSPLVIYPSVEAIKKKILGKKRTVALKVITGPSISDEYVISLQSLWAKEYRLQIDQADSDQSRPGVVYLRVNMLDAIGLLPTSSCPKELPEYAAWLGVDSDGSNVLINNRVDQHPCGFVTGPSGCGKSEFVAHMLNTLLASTPRMTVDIYDPKGCVQFMGMEANMVDPINNPDRALQMLRAMAATASSMETLRIAKGWATMYEGWDLKDSDALKYSPRTVVCDEAFRILRPVKIEKDKNLSPFDLFRHEMQMFLRDSLRSFRCLGYHVILVTQSGRAAEIGSLEGAQDCITYSVIGSQKSRSISEQLIGTGLAFRNPRLQKGVFILDEGGKTLMFRAPFDPKLTDRKRYFANGSPNKGTSND